MITKEIKEEFIQEELAYLATADKDGNPNIGPKRTMRYLDENRLIYAENTGGQHFENIKDNGRVAIAFVKRMENRGFRLLGKATPYYDDEHLDLAQEITGQRPKKACMIIDIEKIYTLSSGPLAGKLYEGE